MSSFFKKTLSGIKVAHHKNTEDCKTVTMPVPAKVSLPMLQHMGAPCVPLVKVNDTVNVGQLIGSSDKFMSAPIHSSVSGRVAAIEEYINPLGVRTQSVIIETDGLQTVDPSVQPPVVGNKEEFLAAVKASGLIGLGGAGFPTFIKLNPAKPEEVDTLVINGAECEPYITTDYREFMENGEEVLEGIAAVVKYLELKYVKIGIEDNKPEAIAKMKELTAGRDGYEVVSLKSSYPQGAEKVLIYETTGRTVKEGQLPADAGAIVMNVSSVGFLARYLKTGMPLVTKRITVDGSAVAKPQNVVVPVGAMISDVMEFCGGYQKEPKLILMGGPMTGIAVYDDAFPVIKNNNAILAFDEDFVNEEPESPCIRCGRCVQACPFDLMPAALEKAYHAKDVDALKALKVNLCMECGSCSYVCPAKRNLAFSNRMAKKFLRENSIK
ncbi:MAG: electron transport complex subunit RsxC [Oscillospiraceae bacterium]|nr:electron transport complex subunit RsxC [Oscillospiraceae bacterium]